MRDQILKIITDNPKRYVQVIKKSSELVKWINENSSINSNHFPERIFNALYHEDNICKYGNTRKFAGITKGYVNCGRSGKCKCASDQVSKTLKNTLSKIDTQRKKQISEKRKETVQKRYNVSNVGQLEKARNRHKETYSDPNKVSAIVSKNKQTKLARYGNENYNNSKKIKDTWREIATSFWNGYYPNKEIDVLADKDKMAELIRTKTFQEIADDLGVHIQTVYRHLNKHGLRSPFQSSYETEIVNFLQELGIKIIVRNSRKILPSGKELDIYLPDFNFAIEFNGIFWHHEDISHITKDYHFQKFKECEDNGIRLITIFSNFWTSKKNIVKSSIKHKLGLNDDVIYARKTEIKKIKSRNTKDFLNSNHIQGYTPAMICYGLYHGDELVSVMTFSTSRVAIGKVEDGYELVRYASSRRVVGGAGKLLSAFRKEFPNETIYSYSNNEWSDGQLYRSLGFQLERERFL